MKISTIKEILDAEVLCCEELVGSHVYSACGSDMMSDVLAYVKDQAVLLTGLVNPQVIRTAEMMDMRCIVFVRSKVPNDEMLALAKESGIVVMTECACCVIRSDYGRYGKVSSLLSEMGAVLTDTAFTDEVTLSFYIEREKTEKLSKELTELSCGDLQVEILGEKFLPV